MKLDDRDLALIRLLEADSRLPAATLARRLGVSRTTVQARIDRLVATGVIAGFTIRLGEPLEQRRVRGHVLVTAAPKAARHIEATLRAMPQVEALHSVSGVYDMIVEVAAGSIEELDRVLDDIGLIEGVERTTSSIILSTRIRR
ncbi:MAG TPA: Lrp/AsnC family transcriptional regulator [Phenylobacterium sp.]|nr:Lrp/AsnC family transcriptional regulator [Phenylobacterium sp.]